MHAPGRDAGFSIRNSLGFRCRNFIYRFGLVLCLLGFEQATDNTGLFLARAGGRAAPSRALLGRCRFNRHWVDDLWLKRASFDFYGGVLGCFVITDALKRK